MAAPAIGLRQRFAPNTTARIDWSHPLAAGLRVLLVPYVGDLVTKLPPRTAPNAGVAVASTSYGPGTTEASATSHWSIIGVAQAAGPLTMAVVFRKGSGSSASACVMNYQSSSTPTSEARGFSVGWGSTTMDGNGTNLVMLDNSVAWKSTGVTLSDGDHVVVLTHPVGGGTLTAYIDGVSVYTSTSQGPTTSGGWSVVLGAQLSNGSSRRIASTDAVVAGATWTRVLSRAEISAITADPFQMLRR
jgi:hypothetical protein